MYGEGVPSYPRPQSRRAALLEFAVLGLLHDGPLHGYELRKRLNTALGIVPRAVLRLALPGAAAAARLGLDPRDHRGGRPAARKRPRIVYELTADGKEHFQDLVAASGPDAWEDDDFDVRFAFFSRTEAEVRLRILEGRRSRLEERLANIRDASQARRERIDSYTLALQRHGEERAEREVRWLDGADRRRTRATALDPGPSAGIRHHRHHHPTRARPPTTRRDPWDPYA